MVWQGLALTLIGGTLGGSVLAPLKLIPRWPFRNNWALYSIWAYLIMPWVVALVTIPHLFSAYAQVSLRTAVICAACGLGWGIAVVLFGVSVDLVGLSLASAIIYGASVAVGSLAPLVISQRERLGTGQGQLIVASNAVMIVGIVLSAFAGKARDTNAKSSTIQANGPASSARFIQGLTASVLASILSSLFNIALAYGGEFNRIAMHEGAKPINAANAQWAFTVSCGYIPNLIVSVFVLSRSKSWRVFSNGPVSHWLWPPVMGAMWIGGTALYGSGAGALGSLGPVIGWPVYVSVMIIVGNFWGWITGEWSQAPRRALSLLGGGILVQTVAIAMLSVANR
jgi:L-rhamnose-H+ transport protein